MSARTTTEPRTSSCASHAETKLKTKEESKIASQITSEMQQAKPGPDGLQDVLASCGPEDASKAEPVCGTAQECVCALAREIRELACETKGLKDLGEQATQLIRRYPVQAVLMGMGVGFLIARTRRS